jgi:hypothetical protein
MNRSLIDMIQHAQRKMLRLACYDIDVDVLSFFENVDCERERNYCGPKTAMVGVRMDDDVR